MHTEPHPTHIVQLAPTVFTLCNFSLQPKQAAANAFLNLHVKVLIMTKDITVQLRILVKLLYILEVAN